MHNPIRRPKIGDRLAVYKLTKPDLTTYNNYSWAKVGKVHHFSGEGSLCGPGHAHVYTSPQLALFMNPIHANFSTYRLFSGVGVVSAFDNGLKMGVRELELCGELIIPKVTNVQRVTFGILCAQCVQPKRWPWAERWLSGKDRSSAAAYAANACAIAAAAYAAAATAAYATDAAADAAYAAAHAAVDAAYAAAYAAHAANAAARSVANAAATANAAVTANAADLDLDRLALEALTRE